MVTHSSILAWRIPCIEELGGLQFMGSLRVGHDWTNSLLLFTFLHWRRKWQPTPVFLPGESQGRGAWWAAVYGVTQSQTQLKRLSIISSRHSLLLNNICMISLFYPFTINLPISLYLMSFLCTAYMWIIYIFFILWYQCAIIYLNIHLLKYIWVASGFEVLWIHYKHSYTVLCLHFKPHFSGINPQEWNFWVIW